MMLIESMMLMIRALIMNLMPVATISMVMIIVKMLITRTVTVMPDEMPVTLVSSARCAVCGGPLPRLAVQDVDPYCSSVCCKAAHQVPLGPGYPNVHD
jgi:hypothetical protein